MGSRAPEKTLVLEADAERPVEVRLRFRDLEVDAGGAAVGYDAEGDQTVVSLPALSRPVTLSWTE